MVYNDQFFVRPFERITNVATYRTGQASNRNEREAGYRTARYRTDAWETVLHAFREQGDQTTPLRAGLRFAAASPEAANLSLNETHRLRDPWISVLLGGANSRWSDFQLAEAMARLMTGTVVRGQFAAAVTRTVPSRPPDTLVTAPTRYDTLASRYLHRGVRRRVLHAMELVTSAPGTAKRLAPYIDRLRVGVAAINPTDPYDLFVVAKTGTPNQPRFVTRPQLSVLEKAFRAGAIVWNSKTSRFSWSLAAAPFSNDTASIQKQFLDPMEMDPDEYVVTLGAKLPRHPLYFERDRLRFQVIRDRRIAGQAGVLVLGLLALPRSAMRMNRIADRVSACRLDPALAADIERVPPVEALDPASSVGLSVAIHVADLNIGQGSDFAVAIAEQMFDEIGAYLAQQVRRKTALP